MGAGLNIGNQIGNTASQILNASTPPPVPDLSYYLAINGQQEGPFDSATIINKVLTNQLTENSLIWKKGMLEWSKISTLEEFKAFFRTSPPPLPFNQ